MSLFSELKRRNVVRVATTYVVVGWLLLQVSDIVLDFTEAPAWIGKVIIALLVLGFFVALVLSWLFEATPEGLRRDDGTGAADPVRAQRMNLLTIVAACGVAAIFAWQQFDAPRTGPGAVLQGEASAGAPSDAAPTMAAPAVQAPAVPEASIDDASIAVLPFADLSPGGDQEYFSDGISEEILNVLAGIEGLAVASRTSAFAFKDRQTQGIPAIAEALKVRHVLEGSVRSAGDTIRITAQLIDARTDKHLWSQTYDRVLSAETVFAIQDEIASSIVEELSRSLGIDDLAAGEVTVRADTDNLDAYQLFLQGRQRFRVRSPANIPGTIEIFQRAVELDPDFARAWAGLAGIAGVAPTWGLPGIGPEYYEVAAEAAQKAISLDDSMALPYAVLATINRKALPVDFVYGFEMYEKALARDPENPSTLLWLSIDLMMVGRFEEAIRNLERCQQVDPGYENCVVFEGVARLFAGDIDGALASYERQAGNNSPSQAGLMAMAVAVERDRFTALLGLAWAVEAFDIPIEPKTVYRSLTDPDFDAEKEFEAYTDERIALTGQPPDLSPPGSIIPLVFRRYQDMVASPQNLWFWHPSLAHFRASPHRKRLIREMGIYDYWLRRGFPPQCRPLGEDDFECD